MNKISGLIISVLLLFSTSCGITVRPYQAGDLLLADNFENDIKNWEIYQDADGSAVSYYQNGLVFLVESEQKNQVSTINRIFSDSAIRVTAEKISGPDNNFFGIICRYMDRANYYGLIISSDGYYGIYRVEDGIFDLISMENMEFSNIINQGERINIIEAVCKGNQLTISVNESQLARVEDNAFSEGKIGLITGTYDQAGSAVLFDNMVVMHP